MIKMNDIFQDFVIHLVRKQPKGNPGKSTKSQKKTKNPQNKTWELIKRRRLHDFGI